MCVNGLTHHGEQSTKDEELSPTLENFIVLTWLRPINPQLPKLVKLVKKLAELNYGHEHSRQSNLKFLRL